MNLDLATSSSSKSLLATCLYIYNSAVFIHVRKEEKSPPAPSIGNGEKTKYTTNHW